MPEKIAIIGAGIAGATAARMLTDAGQDIVLFEKSGGTGGRLSTRRTEFGDFDHGAQYISVKSDPFRDVMDGLIAKNSADFWAPDGKDRAGQWHVGLPGMSGLVKPLLDGVEVRLRTRIIGIKREGTELICVSEDGMAGAFDKIIVAIPSPQASALLKPIDTSFAALDDVVYMPCWTSMFSFEKTIDTLPNLYRGEDTMAISWLTRNNTKPKRSGAESICAQAGGIWSRDKLELGKSEVLELMQTTLEDMAGRKLYPIYAQAHRWRFARVDHPLGAPFLADENDALFAIGDGMLGGRVEAAYESARQLCSYLHAQR